MYCKTPSLPISLPVCVLTAELRTRLHTLVIACLASPDGLPVYRVFVDVQRLDSWLAHSVSLHAVWTVVGPAVGTGTAPSWTCASHVSEPVTAGYEPLVIGAQQGLARVAPGIRRTTPAEQRGEIDVLACQQDERR